MKKWLKDRTAMVVLFSLWITWLVVQLISGTYEVTQEMLHQGEQFAWSDYLTNWLNKVAENNASEMFQIIVAAWVFKYFLYVDSPESRESQDEMLEKVRELHAELVERRQAG